MKTIPQLLIASNTALFFFLLPVLGFGQAKVFYNKYQEKVDSSAGFYYYETVEKLPNGLTSLKRFEPNDSLSYQGTYSKFHQKKESNVKEGLHQYYRKSGGALWYTENYQNGHLQGERRTYYTGGQLKRFEVFEQDSFVRGNCYQEDGSPREYTPFQLQPSFPGGEKELFKYLSENLNYPKLARDNGIEGSVFLTFVVNKDGSVSDVIIVKDIGGGCGDEAKRLIQAMPLWRPGLSDDMPVKVRYTLPLKFKLEGGRKKKRKE